MPPFLISPKGYLAILFILALSIRVSAEDQRFDPTLKCPETQLTSLTGHYELQMTLAGVESQSTILRFLWNEKDRSPQLNLQAALFNRDIGDIFKFFQEHFDEKFFPQEINIVQAPLGAGLGALYCRSYQSDAKKSVTLFLSPKTLESSSEFTRLIAHELVHHWFFKNGKNAAKWIEEGVAYLSEYLVTGRMSGQPVTQYLSHPSASLTETDMKAPMQQMGHAQLLFIYLYDKLGEPFLNHLLTTDMNDYTQIGLSIPPNNDYQWRSFQDAFRDFQIAKYLNRQDYQAQTDQGRMKYFLFPTTLRPEASEGSQAALEWSAVEYKSWSFLTKSQPENFNYEDLVVIDDPSQPISLKKANDASQLTGKRYLRIIYQPR